MCGGSIRQSTFGIQPKGGRSSSPHHVYLKVVKTDFEKLTVKRIIKTFHSYVKQHMTFGRRLTWLIYCDGRCVGTIGLSDCTTFGQRSRDDFIGWTKEDRKKNIYKLVTNYRFTLIEHIPNLASKVLGIMVRIARKQWMEKYGREIVGIDTVVKPPRTGACYRAAGWNQLGMTLGGKEQYQSSIGVTKTKFATPLIVFFKPLVPDFRERLVEYNDLKWFFDLNEGLQELTKVTISHALQ